MKKLITINSTPLDEITDTFLGVPFGNSDFQIQNFIVNGSLTPERAFRTVCLEMQTKISALRTAHFGHEKLKIDLEELDEKINDTKTNKFDKRRYEIEILEKTHDQKDLNKLILDATHELETLHEYWKILPHTTREEFEEKEAIYFQTSLSRQVLGIVGARESLSNMGLEITEKGEFVEGLPTMLLKLQKTLGLDNPAQIDNG